MNSTRTLFISGLVLWTALGGRAWCFPVPKEHPRLLGSRQRLKQLARERPEDYALVHAHT